MCVHLFLFVCLATQLVLVTLEFGIHVLILGLTAQCVLSVIYVMCMYILDNDADIWIRL